MRTAYYSAKFKEGTEYEDFVAARPELSELIGERYIGKRAQFEHGDFAWFDGSGVEVKSARYMKDHGSVFVELFEYSSKWRKWYESGIWAKADWKWYLTGDLEDAYLFERAVLLKYCESLPRKRFNANNDCLGVGFKIPFIECRRLSEERFDFRVKPEAEPEAPKLVGLPCCGNVAGEEWKGRTMVPACKLCPTSPIYWRLNADADGERTRQAGRPDVPAVPAARGRRDRDGARGLRRDDPEPASTTGTAASAAPARQDHRGKTFDLTSPDPRWRVPGRAK